ncbi:MULTISPECIES: DUF1561 family protein [Candidatus Ichthyocystis]|uniref:DUF1561 family protein n=2 Tax=Burkholderiales genera incertae sedis TaxID=224471 RepID=UPI000B869726|nr:MULTISPECIES: DUF1561 family protein [Ichthyocystis]
MLPLLRMVLCYLVLVMTSFPAMAIYYHGGKADDFSDKLEVTDNNGVEYCYSAGLGNIFTVFSNELYLYLDSCDNAPNVRYDIYGRLSVEYENSNYCLTAPEDTVELNNDWGWLSFDRCEVGNRYQQWDVQGNQLLLHGTSFRVQSRRSSINTSLYGAICYRSSECYDTYMTHPDVFDSHYSYPANLDIPMKLVWKYTNGLVYYVGAKGLSSSNVKKGLSINYDPVTRRLTSQSYRVGHVHGAIYHIPQKVCLSSHIDESVSNHNWAWAFWENCDDTIRSVDDVDPKQRWIPIRVGGTGFFSEYSVDGDVYWRDSQGNYLSVAPYGYNFGSLYVINSKSVDYEDSWMTPSVFNVSSGVGRDWLSFESQAFMGIFGDSGRYCSGSDVAVDNAKKRPKTFGKYYDILRDYALRNDGLSSCREVGVSDSLLCLIQGINALYVVTHPVGSESLYPSQYNGTVSEFLAASRHSLWEDISRVPVTDKERIILLNTILDKILPGRVSSLTKDVPMSIITLMGYVYSHPEGILLVLAEDRVHPEKKRILLVISESSLKFQGVRILDTNIPNDEVSVHNFTDAFFGGYDLGGFFASEHLNVDNVYAFSVADRVGDEGSFFYSFRDCDKEHAEHEEHGEYGLDFSYYQALETNKGFSLDSVYQCATNEYNGGLVPSRCWYY